MITHTHPKQAHAGIRKIAHQTAKQTHHTPTAVGPHRCLDARNHYPQIKHHPPPKRGDNQSSPQFSPHSGRRDSGPVVSKPNSVSGGPPSPASITRNPYRLNVCRAPEPHYQVRPIRRNRSRTPNSRARGRAPSLVVLLKKEVIQPRLRLQATLLRLVPIASPTFDGSLPRGSPPASGVTDFHDVTGGVQGPGTYSPQRC